MRALCFAIFMLGCISSTHAQYYVISVQRGQVYADGQELKKKDKIAENANLRFTSAEAYVKVMAPGKGYFILGVSKNQRSVDGKVEFLVALKEAIFPPNEYPLPGIRSNDPSEVTKFQDQYDLKAFFRDDVFFVDKASFEVSSENFPLDDAHYFAIRHYLQDGWFAKRLAYEAQHFELNPDIYTLGQQFFPAGNVQYSELYYIDEETGEEQYLGRFNLQFVDKEQLTEELTWLYSLLDHPSLEEFYQMHALPHVTMEYGKTQPEQIKALLTSIIK